MEVAGPRRSRDGDWAGTVSAMTPTTATPTEPAPRKATVTARRRPAGSAYVVPGASGPFGGWPRPAGRELGAAGGQPCLRRPASRALHQPPRPTPHRHRP